VQQASRILWRVGGVSAEGSSATFSLKLGHYTLELAAVRKLNFRAYGAQRYVNGATPLPLSGLSATTNRIFNEDGKEINGTARNELAKTPVRQGRDFPRRRLDLRADPRSMHDHSTLAHDRTGIRHHGCPVRTGMGFW
jgi:hypothetical protein